VTTQRQSAHPIEPLLLERWSPRAFDGSAVNRNDIAAIFEAARWAPSAFNVQPWRFIYALRDDADWQRLLGLLIPFNASWVKNAGALIFICSDTLMAPKPDQPPQLSHSHSFDAGAAWALMALQATALGYRAHGMTGLLFDRCRSELEIPERFRLEAAVAIGKQGDKSVLPEALQAREVPSERKPLGDLVFHARFGSQSDIYRRLDGDKQVQCVDAMCARTLDGGENE
jgi:nitroreductase